MEPVFSRRPDGTLAISRIPLWLARVLLEVPALIDESQPPEVRARLFPDPSDDEEQKAEWERLMVPELFALLASARQVVVKDLELLERTSTGLGGVLGKGRLEITAAHRHAWISGLNAARLALGARHAIEETDMDEDRAPPEWTEREGAIARIQLLGWLQGTLILDASPPPTDGEPKT